MAAINYKQAQVLADEMIKAGRAKPDQRDALIQQLIVQSKTGEGGAPQSAIASALMAPLPQTVTPATPAPVAPGVPLAAPKPTALSVTPSRAVTPEDVRQGTAPAAPAAPQAPVVDINIDEQAPAPQEKKQAAPSRYRQALSDTLAEIQQRQAAIAEAQKNKTPVPITEQARLNALGERAKILKSYVDAEEAAQVPEEALGVLSKQEERLKAREERLGEAKRISPWEALLAGSAAMSRGVKGERFGEALSRGLQTGLQAYAQSKNENAQGLEAIGEARDAAVMKRYDLLQKARDDAIAMVNSGQKIDKDVAEVAKMNDEQAMRIALMPLQLRKGEAEATLSEFEAKVAPEKFALEKGVKGAQIAAYNRSNRGAGRSGTTGIKAAGSLLTSYAQEAQDYTDTINNPLATKAEKDKARRNLQQTRLQIMALRSAMLGNKVPLAAGAGGQQANYVYVPGKGLQTAK